MEQHVIIRFIGQLLDIGALQINIEKPYTWASGWKSPVYCDNRKILSHTKVRTYVKLDLSKMVRSYFPKAEVIASVATAGIAHGAILADALTMPLVYVRPKPKEHGMGNQIEGDLLQGQKVVVIEDLVSTGKSSLHVVDVLRAHGAEVLGVCALFTYGFPETTQAFADANVPLYTIGDYNTLMEVAQNRRLIQPGQLEVLEQWRLDPARWVPATV